MSLVLFHLHWQPHRELVVAGEDVRGGPEGLRAGDPGGAGRLNHLLPCDPAPHLFYLTLSYYLF